MSTRPLHQRIINRLIHEWRTITFKPYMIQAFSEGEHFNFWIASPQSQKWYVTNGQAAWPEMRFVRDVLLAPGCLVVECGAHHGFGTMLLSRWVGMHGKVMAFEAIPGRAAVLKKNVQLNSAHNVNVYARAVSNTAKKRSVLLARSLAQQVRLDDVLDSKIPGLLKIDVDGYETEVIKGAWATLAHRKTNLSIEVHPHELQQHGSSVQELQECLHLDDYHCWLGMGSEATKGITQFLPGTDQLPGDARFYLFAIPKHR